MITSDRKAEQGFIIQSVGTQSRPVIKIDGLSLTYLPVPKNSKNSDLI